MRSLHFAFAAVYLSLLLLLLAGCGGSDTSKPSVTPQPSKEARAREWRIEVRLTLLDLRDASAAFVSATAKGLAGLREHRRESDFVRALDVLYACGEHLEDVTPPLARLREGIAVMKTACKSFRRAHERGSKGDFAGARREIRKGLALLDRAEVRLRQPFCGHSACVPELWSL